MTLLEDRFRAELLAESELIEPESIPPLRLPAPRPLSRLRLSKLRRPFPPRWPAWTTALAAAAAVVAVGAVPYLVFHSGPTPPAAQPSYSGVPSYYAYAVQGNTFSRIVHGTQVVDGVIARYVNIRATTTGKLVTRVSPPAPYSEFESFTGAASDRTFVFTARRDTYDSNGNEKYQQDQRMPLKFMILRLTADGQPRLTALSLPKTLTAAQQPTMALSPQGTRLAVAYGGSGHTAVVQVITLATGQIRQWTAPPPAATPVLTGLGAWTASGRVLAVGQMVTESSGTIRNGFLHMRLLDTAAPGKSLASARQVTLAGSHAVTSFLTPDGTKLISARGKTRPGGKGASGALGVYSARTGALLRVIGRWRVHGRQPPLRSQDDQFIAWSNRSGSRLIVEIPHDNASEIGFLAGDHFTPLPHAALAPLRWAMNSGGFQTSGGYVGFAW